LRYCTGRCCQFSSRAPSALLHNRRRITGVLVSIDDSRRPMVLCAQGFGAGSAQPLPLIAFGRKKEVDRRTAGVHGPVQIHPLALDPDVGLIHPPTVVGWFAPRAQTSFHFRGVTLYPSPHPHSYREWNIVGQCDVPGFFCLESRFRLNPGEVPASYTAFELCLHESQFERCRFQLNRRAR
jgi:hypothetical protein